MLKMKIVHNKKEFEKVYYYDKKYLEKKDYPRRYPCIVILQDHDGGLMGSYVSHIKIYPPKKCCFDSWVKGVKAGMDA